MPARAPKPHAKDRDTIWQQIATTLRAEIAAGTPPPGGRLP